MVGLIPDALAAGSVDSAPFVAVRALSNLGIGSRVPLATNPRFFPSKPDVEPTYFDLYPDATAAYVDHFDVFYMPRGFDKVPPGRSGRALLESGFLVGSGLRDYAYRKKLYNRIIAEYVVTGDHVSPADIQFFMPGVTPEDAGTMVQTGGFLANLAAASVGTAEVGVALGTFSRAMDGVKALGEVTDTPFAAVSVAMSVIKAGDAYNDFSKLVALYTAFNSDLAARRLKYLVENCKLADPAFTAALAEQANLFRPDTSPEHWRAALSSFTAESATFRDRVGDSALAVAELVAGIIFTANPAVGAIIATVDVIYQVWKAGLQYFEHEQQATLVASMCLSLESADINSFDYHFAFGRMTQLYYLKLSQAEGDLFWHDGSASNQSLSDAVQCSLYLDAAPAEIAAYLGGYNLDIFPPAWINGHDGNGSNAISISWENRSPQAVKYHLYRGTTADSAAAVEVAAPIASTYTDTSAEFDVTYFFWVTVETTDHKFSPFTHDFATARRVNPNPGANAPFTIPAITDAQLSTSYLCAPLTMSGLTGPTSVSVNRGSYSINGGPFTSGISKVSNGDVVVVKQTSSSNYFTTVRATLAVGARTVNFDLSTAALEALAVTVNLSASSALPYAIVTVTGQVKNAGVTVTSGSIYISSGPNTWKADIVNGSYSQKVVAPTKSGSITVEALVGGLTGHASHSLTITAPGSRPEKITTAITRSSAITAKKSSIKWDYVRDSFSRTDPDVTFIMMVENGPLDFVHAIEFRVIDHNGAEVDRFGGSIRSSASDGFAYFYQGEFVNGYLLGSKIGNYLVQYYLDGTLVATKDFVIGYELAQFQVGVGLTEANSRTLADALAAVTPRTVLFSDEHPTFGVFLDFERMSEVVPCRLAVFKPGGDLWAYSTEHNLGGSDPAGYLVYSNFDRFVHFSIPYVTQGWPFYLTVPPYIGEWLIGLEVKDSATGRWTRLAEKHLTVVDRTAPDVGLSIRRNDAASEIFGESYLAKMTFGDAYGCAKVTLFWDGALAGSKVLLPSLGQWWWESTLGPFFIPEDVHVWAEVVDTSGNVRTTPTQTLTVSPYGQITAANSLGIGFQINALAYHPDRQNYYVAGGIVTATDTSEPSGYIQRLTHAPKLAGHVRQEVYHVLNGDGVPVPPISDIQMSPDGLFLYAVAERYFIVLAVQPDGQLQQRSCLDSTGWASGAPSPRLLSIAVHPSGQRVLLADEGRNAVISIQRRFSDNEHVVERWLALPESTKPQYAPPSQLVMSPTGREIAVSNNAAGRIGWLAVGATDGALPATIAYTTFLSDAFGTVPAGDRRQAQYAGDGQMLYLTSYLGGTLNSYRRNDSKGTWELFQSIANSSGASFTYPTAVTVSPDNRNLYVLSSRIMSSSGVYEYARDLLTGQLKAVGSLTRGSTGASYYAEQMLISSCPDGYKVYYVSRTNESILQFQRAGREYVPQVVAVGQARATGAVEPAVGWVTATGANLTYQWYRGVPGDRTVPMGWATAMATFPLVAEARTYWAEVTNGAGSAASPAMIVAGVPVVAPYFTVGPADQTIMETGVATFSATAQGVPLPSLRWQYRLGTSGNWAELTDGAAPTGGVYTGVSGAKLQVSGTTMRMSGYQYRCIASNAGAPEVASLPATLTISPFESTPSFAHGQPESMKATASGHASFTVTVSGVPAPSLRWQVSSDGGITWSDVTNGGNYSGATTATLFIEGATAAMNGYKYRVLASNAAQDDVASNTVTLSVGLLNVLADMVAIPGGTFTMGDSKSEGGADEKPLHAVTLSSFYLWRTEVTYAQWGEVADWNRAGNYGYDFRNGQRGATDNGTALPDSAGNNLHPVTMFSWWDAVKWCNAKSRKEGYVPCYYTDAAFTTEFKSGTGTVFTNWTANGYRLPTEAEWEYAARGGLSGKSFPWGDGIGNSRANFRFSNDPFNGTTPMAYFNGNQVPAGTDTINGFGLYDMSGNVAEWCWDVFDTYGSSAQTNPLGPQAGSYHVYRGGSWVDDTPALRNSARASGYMEVMGSVLGFRPAQLLPPAPVIDGIADQSVRVCQSTADIPFSIVDAETPASSLIVSAKSSNEALVPVSGIVFGGAGSNRTVRVTPVLNQVGDVTITVTVSDGNWSSATSFLVKIDVRRVYVRAGATGLGDGTSWLNAYPGLDAALANSEPGDRVWLAQGVYKPTPTTDRAVRFLLLENQQLIGGFAGTEDSELQADAIGHPTVLSGDIGVEQDPSDNSQIVLETLTNTRVANLTIRDATGSATIHGGLLMRSGSNMLVVENCIFDKNFSVAGAGLTSYGADTRLIRCVFKDNTTNATDGSASGDGAGALLLGKGSSIVSSSFLRNHASGDGGGVRATQLDLIANCIFEENSGSSGGGLSGGATLLDHVVFRRNKAQNGAAVYVGGATFDSCVITDNSADSGIGYAAVSCAGQLILKNCLFAGNSSSAVGTSVGRSVNASGNLSVSHCTFWSLYSGAGQNTEILASGQNNTFTNSIFWEPDTSNLLRYYRGRSASFRNCIVKGGINGGKIDVSIGTLTDRGGNQSLNPLFIDSHTPEGIDGKFFTEDDGFGLTSNSPARDAGVDDEAVYQDIVGTIRPIGMHADMGAYEFPVGTPTVSFAGASMVKLSISNSAGSQVQFQWQASLDNGNTWRNLSDEGIYSGTTTVELTINAGVSALSGNKYRILASVDSNSTISPEISLLSPRINLPSPVIATVAGVPTEVAASVTGTPSPTVAWQVSLDDGSTWNDIHDGGAYSGAATAKLTIVVPITPMSGWRYRVRLTDSEQSRVTSEAITLAVAAAQTGVVGWGANEVGQLAVPGSLVDAIGVTAGMLWAAALTSDGHVVAWGESSGLWRQIPADLHNVIAISGNYYHVLALRVDGAVVAWGGGTHGDTIVPTDLSHVVAVSAGYMHSVALKADGRVAAWGINSGGECSVPADLSDVVSIAAGGNHTLALRADGHVVAWGWNDVGQSTVPLGLSGVVQIAAGYRHSLALKSDGTIVVWGANDFGQTVVPNEMPAAKAIVAGIFHSLVMPVGGGVLAWGDNRSAQSVAPSGLRNVKGAAGGGYFSLVLQSADSNSAPNISLSPLNQSMIAGGSVSFSVSVVGSPSSTLQWEVSTNSGATWTALTNGSGYSGVTTPTLTIIGGTVEMNDYRYRVTASNLVQSNVASAAAKLTVNTAPVFTVQPQPQAAPIAAVANFAAAAIGPPAPTFIWQVSENAGATWTDLIDDAQYSGASTASLTIASVTAGLDGNRYRVLASNLAASNVSSLSATLTVNFAPVFVTQPQPQTIRSGNTVTFSASAVGPPTPTYQWQFSANAGGSWADLHDGGIYSGSTSGTLTISPADASLHGNLFRVLASNAFGSNRPSLTASLTVDSPPTFTLQPQSKAASVGQTVTFSAAASGPPAASLRWQFRENGGAAWANIADAGVYSGTETTNLVISGITATMGGYQYRALATNRAEADVPSTVATLTVNLSPVFVTQPISQAVKVGDTVSLFAAAVGPPTPSLRWQICSDGGKNWTDLPNAAPYSGVATSGLTITGAPMGLSGAKFRAIASNIVAADVASDEAVLTLTQVLVWPSKKKISAAGATYMLLVDAAQAWLAKVDAPWISVSLVNGGAGAAEILVRAEVNQSSTERTAILTVGDAEHHLVQLGADSALRELYAVGENGNGQLGDGSISTRMRPMHINSDIAAVSSGAFHALYSKLDGSLWAMGRNNWGQLGDGTGTERAKPVQVASNVRGHATGRVHSLFVKSDGSLWGTGFNIVGQLGDGNYNNVVFTPKEIDPNVSWVAAGAYQSYFGRADKSLWGMGSNEFQTFESNSSVSLTLSPRLFSYNVVNACGGYYFCLYLTADGQLWATGDNSFGELGDGSGSNIRYAPILVTGDVKAMAAGFDHALFIKNDGSLWGMGKNTYGQLGDGSRTDRYSPVHIADNVGLVAAGANHSLFVKTDGSLWSMGDNTRGQLGDGTLIQRNSPVGIEEGVVAISANNDQSYYIREIALPGMTTQPSDQLVNANGTASFKVAVRGFPVPRLQWQVSVDGGVSWDKINDNGLYLGSTTPTLTVSGATPGMNGYSYRVSASGFAVTNVTSSSANLAVASFALWQQGTFTALELGNTSVSGAAADPDSDGICNLLEYALALAPKTADRTGLPSIGTIVVSGQKYLTFTYTHQKPATAPDLTYTLVASTDLAGWSPITPVTLATVDQGASESVTVRDTVAIGATRGRFLRLSVSTQSTTATTPAVGAVTLPTLANSDTLVSVPLARPSVYQDKLSVVNGPVLTVTGTPGWTANQFVKNLPTQANTYYVQLKTGSAAGHFYTVTANAASTLTVDWNGETPNVAAGDQLELIPYWSLGTLYPPADAGVSFTNSINAAVRSTELIFPDLTYVGINPPTAATYYFASGAWHKVGAAALTSFSDLVLTPDSYFVQRNKAAASQLTSLGAVVTGPLATLLNAQGGTAKQDNPIALRFAGTVTLAQSNLVGSGVFQSSVNAALRKDELLVYDNTTSGINKSVSATYYYSGGAWRKVGASASADFGTDAVFTPGTGVILRKAGTGAGNPAQDSFWIFIVNP